MRLAAHSQLELSFVQIKPDETSILVHFQDVSIKIIQRSRHLVLGQVFICLNSQHLIMPMVSLAHAHQPSLP